MPALEIKLFKLPVALKNAGLVGWKRLFPILQRIFNGTLHVSVEGGEISATNNGFHLKMLPAASVPYPFEGTMNSTTECEVNSGVVNGTPVPTDTLTVSDTGVQYVWLKITCTLTVAYDYVNSFTVDTMEFAAGSTVPTDDTVAGEYYVPVIEITDGVITNQLLFSGIGFEVLGDNTQTSSGMGRYWR